MSVQPEFDTVEEADQAYHGGGDGSSDDGGNDTPGSARWGELQTKDTDWVAGWTLAFQREINQESTGANSGGTRWFVFRVNPETGNFEALNMSGQADTYAEDAALEELPHTQNEDEARNAYQTWLEENEPEQEEQGDEWTEWTQLNQVAGWTIWGRESQTSDAVQFLAAALDNEDREIYLQPEGEIGQEPHLFESQSTLQTALDAYQTRVENGEIDERRQASGRSPGRGAINDATMTTSTSGLPGPLAGAVDAVGGPTNAVFIAAAALMVLYYLDAEGHVELGISEFVNDLGGNQA